MQSSELTSPTPAKQAQVKALGHTAALKELASELPAGSRGPEDEAVLREWHQEGRVLRNKAEDLAVEHRRPVHLETRGGMLTTPEEHRELVTVGEIKTSSGPTQ